MPLKIQMKPNEKIIINGAEITAGDKSITIFIHNRSSLMRGSDILSADEAQGVEKSLYFALQKKYLSGDANAEIEDIQPELDGLSVSQPETALEIKSLIKSGDLYKAMRRCRNLFRAGASSQS